MHWTIKVVNVITLTRTSSCMSSTCLGYCIASCMSHILGALRHELGTFQRIFENHVYEGSRNEGVFLL